MYRPPTKRQRETRARLLEAMRRGKQRAALARGPSGRMPELPALRRVVEVTDYDSGAPVTRRIELWKTRRVDVYRVVVDGVDKQARGWSRVCDALRVAYPRVPSPRSDAWR